MTARKRQHPIPAKRKTAPTLPKSERDTKFCERWLVHRDHIKAFKEAGYSGKHNDVSRQALDKLTKFRAYLERQVPKVEAVVAKRIGYERADILEGIARIANANALDYIQEYEVIDAKTGAVTTAYRMKPIQELTRDQAAALDTVSYHAESGTMTYSLPAAKTRLSAFTTLGEQAAGFSKKDEVHNHLHLDNVPLEKLRHIKGLLIEMVGPNAARQVFGMHDEPEISE